MQSEYCITIDEEWVIDGAGRSSDTEMFSPCHINHSRQRFNVARRTLPSKKRVELYAAKDVRCVLQWCTLHCDKAGSRDQCVVDVEMSCCSTMAATTGRTESSLNFRDRTPIPLSMHRTAR